MLFRDIFSKNKKTKRVEETTNSLLRDVDTKMMLEKIASDFNGILNKKNSTITFAGDKMSFCFDDCKTTNDIQTKLVNLVNAELFELKEHHVPLISGHSSVSNYIKGELNVGISNFLGYKVSLGNKEELTQQEVENLLNKKPIQVFKEMEASFPGSTYFPLSGVLKLSNTPEIKISFGDVGLNLPDEYYKDLLITQCLETSNYKNNPILTEYILSGLNQYFHTNFTQEELPVLYGLFVTSYGNKQPLCDYLQIKKCPDDFIEPIKENFIKTSRIEVPQISRGDKDFYANMHMNFLKMVYSNFVNNEIYDFDKNKDRMRDLVNNIQNIENVEKWNLSQDVKELEDTLKTRYESSFEKYQKYEVTKYEFVYPSINEREIARFCFKNYDNIEGAISSLSRLRDIIASDIVAMKILNEIASKEKEKSMDLE